MTEILKDILVSAGDVDRYYETSPVNLWRAKRIKDQGPIFGLIEEDKILSNGQIRPSDITITVENGIRWVSCRLSPRGISTFDKPNVFKGSSWGYYKIPKGTKLPSGLAIIKDKFNSRMGATHYTLAPAFNMPLTKFKFLLDQLAISVQRDVA